MSAQRQDSLQDQIQDVLTAARDAGCYDAHDWIVQQWQFRASPRSFNVGYGSQPDTGMKVWAPTPREALVQRASMIARTGASEGALLWLGGEGFPLHWNDVTQKWEVDEAPAVVAAMTKTQEGPDG